jgi:hypothetical protein
MLTDLFYIAPFYHTALPVELEFLVVLDVDLVFRLDILLLPDLIFLLESEFKGIVQRILRGVNNKLK